MCIFLYSYRQDVWHYAEKNIAIYTRDEAVRNHSLKRFHDVLVHNGTHGLKSTLGEKHSLEAIFTDGGSTIIKGLAPMKVRTCMTVTCTRRQIIRFYADGGVVIAFYCHIHKQTHLTNEYIHIGEIVFKEKTIAAI